MRARLKNHVEDGKGCPPAGAPCCSAWALLTFKIASPASLQSVARAMLVTRTDSMLTVQCVPSTKPAKLLEPIGAAGQALADSTGRGNYTQGAASMMG